MSGTTMASSSTSDASFTTDDMTSSTSITSVADAVRVGNVTVIIDLTTRTIDTLAGNKTAMDDVTTVTSLTSLGISTNGVVSSAAISSQTFAVIVGCSVSAAVLLALIILIIVCWFVRPVMYRKKKPGSQERIDNSASSTLQICGQETVFSTSTSNFKSPNYVTSSVRKPPHDTLTNDIHIMHCARPTFANAPSNGVTVVKAQNGATDRRKHSTPHAVSTMVQPPVAYCGHGNFYYSGHRIGTAEAPPGDGDSQYDGSVSSLGDASSTSLRDSYVSVNSTTPLHRPQDSQPRPPRKQLSRDKSDERLRQVAPLTATTNDSPHNELANNADTGASQNSGKRRRAESQKSVRSLTEDVWNSTVDLAFDSALSLYEPL